MCLLMVKVGKEANEAIRGGLFFRLSEVLREVIFH